MFHVENILLSQQNNAAVGLDFWMSPIACLEVVANSSECPTFEVSEKEKKKLMWLNNLESHTSVYIY